MQPRKENSKKAKEECRRSLLESEFKGRHLGLVGVFAWIFCIHAVGIYFFTKGFLLTRMVLENKSACDVVPFGTPRSSHAIEASSSAVYERGCWHPKVFNKAIVVIIDALRYDFTVPYRLASESAMAHLFHDNIPVFYETAVNDPTTAFLLPFIADPPTTTLQRLKGLTTGTLPTFVDAGSNFAGSAIDEDNLVAQLRAAGKTLVQLGDDTWQSLYPEYFEPNLTKPFDSFNVRDLHTVDNGVNNHLFPLVSPENYTKWDVIFAHYLGVDHAGHRYGPNHPAMAAKLRQMDTVVRNLIQAIDVDTLLVVMGDHGMDSKGDHGGESEDEVEAALWMYAKKGIFGRFHPEYAMPPQDAKTRAIPQIDLVPTLSLLLGIPIPFNSLGSPIEEAFIGPNGDDLDNLIAVNRLASAQIRRYQHEYSIAQGTDDSPMDDSLLLYATAENEWRKLSGPTRASLQTVYDLYKNYQRHTLQVCHSLWAKFDMPSMIQGVAVLLAGIVMLVVYARTLKSDRTDLTSSLLYRITVFAAVGGLIGPIPVLSGLIEVPVLEGSCLMAAVCSLFGASTVFVGRLRSLSSPLPNSLWGWLAVFFTVSQSVGFASNSYTIWEDEILLFFLTSFGVLAGISSMRQKATSDRVLGAYHAVIFVIVGRIASFSRLCRDEQMPFCRSTYYASATSSTSAPWHLAISFLVAVFLPAVVRSFYDGSKSYEGAATLWIGIAFRLGLTITAFFSVVDAAEDGEWFSIDKGTLKTTRTFLAQVVLALAFGAGTTAFIYSKPCVTISVSQVNTGSDELPHTAAAAPKQPGRTTVTILGFGNVYGTRFFFLVVNFCLAIVLMQKPMGQGAVALQLIQILSLLEILDTNGLTSSNSAIGPVVLGLIGSFYFFKTGHQATLSSIQWKSAFIPLSTVKYPWSPLLVTLNTFGAQILTSVAVPLVVLWKRPFQIDNNNALAGSPPSSSSVHPSSSSSSAAASASSFSSSSSDPSSLSSPSSQSSSKNPVPKLLSDVAQAAATYILYFATINVSTAMWAGHLRRHLMLYRIFCPRFMMAAAVLAVVDVVVMLIGVGGVRWSTLSVGEVFGW